MVYVDGIISNSNEQHQFHIDADDMKQLMDDVLNIGSNFIYRVGKYDIISFKSNIINVEHFKKLTEMYRNKCG